MAATVRLADSRSISAQITSAPSLAASRAMACPFPIGSPSPWKRAVPAPTTRMRRLARRPRPGASPSASEVSSEGISLDVVMVWQRLLSRLKLHASGAQKHGEHFIVTNQKTQLDQLRLVEMLAQGIPGVVRDVALDMQFVSRPHQKRLKWRPAIG